jgi:hypothetical protein
MIQARDTTCYRRLWRFNAGIVITLADRQLDHVALASANCPFEYSMRFIQERWSLVLRLALPWRAVSSYLLYAAASRGV